MWQQIRPCLNYEISDKGVVRNITTWREVKRRGQGNDVYVSLPSCFNYKTLGVVRCIYHFKIYALMNEFFPIID